MIPPPDPKIYLKPLQNSIDLFFKDKESVITSQDFSRILQKTGALLAGEIGAQSNKSSTTPCSNQQNPFSILQIWTYTSPQNEELNFLCSF